MEQRHRLSGTIYEHIEVGHVLVRDEAGVTGVFDRFGVWIEGERHTADPQMCSWVADGCRVRLPNMEAK